MEWYFFSYLLAQLMCQFDFLISLQSNLAPLANVRHQIVRLLGSLGGQTNMLLLGSGEIDPSRAVAWDTENHLVFAVPFQDMKPNIYLGMMKTERVIRSAFHFQNSGSVIKWNGNFMEKICGILGTCGEVEPMFHNFGKKWKITFHIPIPTWAWFSPTLISCVISEGDEKLVNGMNSFPGWLM